MTKKKYLIFRAILYVITACFVMSIPFWQEIDSFGLWFSFIFPFVLLFLAYRLFKQSKLTGTEEKLGNPYAPPANATIKDQVKYYTKMIYLSAIGCSILTSIIVSDLNDLESGEASSISLWAPVSFVYKQGGYWPAVFAVPFLCLCLTAIFLWKIKKINTSDSVAA